MPIYKLYRACIYIYTCVLQVVSRINAGGFGHIVNSHTGLILEKLFPPNPSSLLSRSLFDLRPCLWFVVCGPHFCYLCFAQKNASRSNEAPCVRRPGAMKRLQVAAGHSSPSSPDNPFSPTHTPSAIALSPGELFELLRTRKDVLLLDCRSFIAHNQGHINGALNITCPTLLLKRLRQKSKKRRPSHTGQPQCVLLEKLVNSQEVCMGVRTLYLWVCMACACVCVCVRVCWVCIYVYMCVCMML